MTNALTLCEGRVDVLVQSWTIFDNGHEHRRTRSIHDDETTPKKSLNFVRGESPDGIVNL